MNSAASAAIEAVGEAGASDWKLDPAANAAGLPARAGALRRVLEGPDVAAITDGYSVSDAAAIKAQAQYRRWSSAASTFRFLSILFGAAALLKSAHGAGYAPAIGIGVGLQYASIFAALVCTVWLRIHRPLEVWMGKRAAAENLRLQLFNRVVSSDEPATQDELPLLPLKLEYFRRYQLDVQRAYYRRRGQQHAQAARRTLRWQICALALTVAAVIPATLGLLDAWTGALPASFRPLAAFAVQDLGKIALLAIGIISSALGDLLATQSLSSLDQRNAARYLSNAESLDFLSETYLPEVRREAAEGNEPPVRDFVDLVHNSISSEHREWVHIKDLAKTLSMERYSRLKSETWSGRSVTPGV